MANVADYIQTSIRTFYGNPGSTSDLTMVTAAGQHLITNPKGQIIYSGGTLGNVGMGRRRHKQN